MSCRVQDLLKPSRNRIDDLVRSAHWRTGVVVRCEHTTRKRVVHRRRGAIGIDRGKRTTQ